MTGSSLPTSSTEWPGFCFPAGLSNFLGGFGATSIFNYNKSRATTDSEVGLSARYVPINSFEVYFDAANLLNGPCRRYMRDNHYTIEWERFDRRLTAGFPLGLLKCLGAPAAVFHSLSSE